MKTEILKLLRDSREYCSGQELCERFGVSRTAVWKVMNQLKEEGYEIEAVQNRGYRLKSAPDVLSASELQSRIHTKWAGSHIHYQEETDSTNIDAKQCMEAGEPHGTVAIAESQRAGRGRRGRSWQSPKGECVYMTIGLRPEFAPAKASMLTLVMALSIAEAIEEETGLAAAIKWPNDVVVNHKKVCGILTEMSMETDYIRYVVIGAGINLKQESFPTEIAKTATSLYLESGQGVLRPAMIARVLQHFENDYEAFLRTEDLSELMERYDHRLVNKEQKVRVLDPKGEYEGIAKGIRSTGELMVELPDGTRTDVYAGEVSVRGYYGYA